MRNMVNNKLLQYEPLQYFPVGQSLHSEAVSIPVMSLYVPSGHGAGSGPVPSVTSVCQG